MEKNRESEAGEALDADGVKPEKTVLEHRDVLDQLQIKTEDLDITRVLGRWKGKAKATSITDTMYYGGASVDDLRGFIAYCDTEQAQVDDKTKIDFAVRHLTGAPKSVWECYRRDHSNDSITWQDFRRVLEGALHTTIPNEPLMTNSLPPESLTCFHNNGATFTSASVLNATKDYDLIDFLAAAQHRKIDILPFRWDSRELIGMGGTANVSHGGKVETTDGLQMNFVFKRVRRTTSGRSRSQDYQALLSEVFILGHPVVRHHPNIIALEGFCWETVNGESWPVLVFKRTIYGDLGRFMRSKGTTLGFEERVKLCREIGDALLLMHSCHVVHGDLKPENILIFLDIDGKYSAKVADFGYSTIFAEDSDSAEVVLPKSWPWTAPEVEERSPVTLAEAKSADIFSYGLICLWVLSYELWLENLAGPRPDLRVISDIKRTEDLVPFAQGAVICNMGEMEDGPQMLALMLHLSTSLIADQHKRRLQVDNLRTPFNYTMEALPLIGEYGALMSAMEASPFDLIGMFTQFRASGPSVWQAVRESLEKRAESSSQVGGYSQNIAAYQLAFCYEVGFGTNIDKNQAVYWLERSDKSQEDLDDAIEMIRDDINPHFKNMTTKIDYFDKNKVPKGSSENMPTNGTSSSGGKEASLEDPFVMASTAAWIHKSLGIDPGEMRIAMFEDKSVEELTESARQLSKEQFGWKEGEYQASNIELVMDPDVFSREFPIETFMRTEGSEPAHETTEDEENRLVRSIDRKKKVLRSDHEDTLRSMDALIAFYNKHGRYDEAVPLAIHVMETRRETLGQPHPSTLKSMRKGAGLLLILGNMEEGEALLLKVLDTRSRILGYKHPDALETYNDLKSVFRQYMTDEKHDKARTLVERLLSFCVKAFGDDNDETLSTMEILALLVGVKADYQGGHAKAEGLLNEVIRQRKRLPGKDDKKILEVMFKLAAVHEKHVGEIGVEEKLHALQVDMHNAQARLSMANIPTTPQSARSEQYESKEEISNIMAQYLDLSFRPNSDPENHNKSTHTCIQEIEEALTTLPDDSPDRPKSLSKLYASRFHHYRDVEDLELALTWEQQALLVLPENDPENPLRLTELSNLYWLYFETTSSLKHLEKSLEYGEYSIESTADDDDLGRIERIRDLSIRSRKKYDEMGDIDALANAIVWAEQMTFILTDPGKVPNWLIMLGSWLRDKYKTSQSIEDISGAIDAFSKAASDPLCTLSGSQLYNELSDLYSDRYVAHKADADDLNKAVEWAGRAVQEAQALENTTLRGGESPYGPLLGDLASKYFQRSQAFKDIKDLEKAASTIDEAVRIVPLESRYRQEVLRIRSLIHSTQAILGGTYDTFEDYASFKKSRGGNGSH